MVRNVMIALLAIGVAGTAYWGYSENKKKEAVMLHAENNYQRAFHNLAYHMDVLHDKIGTALAMNSNKTLSPALADVWRITSDARSDVGQLPLSLMPFNQTEEFLANIGNFSYRTAVRDLKNEPLSDKEYGQLKNMYSQSSELRTELRKLQHQVLTKNLRWMDVDLALSAGEEKMDNTIVDGFQTVEKRVGGYEQTDMENPATVSFQQREESFKSLKGEKITKKQGLAQAKKLAGLENVTEKTITENHKGAGFDFYSISMKGGNGEQATMDVTKVGGHPIWFMLHRNLGKQQVSLHDAGSRAKKFLDANGYQNLKLLDSVQYDTMGLITFAPVQDGVTIYPESINVKVALDNGQVVGMAASDYIRGKDNRALPQPKLTAAEARGFISQKVKVMDENLAVVENDLGKEVLCHEFIGTLDNDTYRIFINVLDGTEEKIERLQNAETMYELAV